LVISFLNATRLKLQNIDIFALVTRLKVSVDGVLVFRKRSPVSIWAEILYRVSGHFKWR
jgi:hypothetical protein